ncbi:hypothetical protein Taro_054861 [Colocasia esculenta]|uniref:VQ domain-containing protein n=1 Tax=Colocasia esculenta TaxID=4460 RepID=A0A843XR94_COLES|nr:hypothetical protein [Colocasia esculenta]
MESGNSSSVQSSSGGDEEYDSRADSFSCFLSPHHPPPPSASSLDPFSAYLDAFSRTPPAASNSNSILNCTGIVGLAGPAMAAPYASSSTPIGSSHRPFVGNINMGSPLSPSSLSQRPSVAPFEQSPSGAAAAAPPRGSKKRSRASRRAPTTVLTTDTSNFRAMVQEFTGFPSPPFPSPVFVRPRLDLLRAGISGTGRPTVVPDPMPGYLLRPFAQKVPVPFASGSSSPSSSAYASAATSLVARPTSSMGANASTTGAAAAAAAPITAVSTGTTITTNSHHLPWNVGLGSQHHNLLSMFNFQSLLPLSSAAQNNCSPNAPTPSHGIKIALHSSAATYGIGDCGHAGASHLGTLVPSLAGSEGLLSLSGGGNTGRDDVLRWLEDSSGTDGGEKGQFRHTGGSHGARQRGSSFKQNCTGSASSDYHPEKGKEKVPARGEGMVDSWISSSD